MRVIFCTTCKGRLFHLRQTLPVNFADNPSAKFVILDYNSDDGLSDYLRTEHADAIESGRLVVYHHPGVNGFHMAHAKNMAMRCGIAEGADILVTLDADNYTGLGFDTYIQQKFRAHPNLSFIQPDFESLPPPGKRFVKDNPILLGRGFAGRLAIRANDFLKAGGYNQTFDTWRGEDIDLIERLKRLGLKRNFIDPCFLNAINHTSQVRFAHYPEAERFENNDIYSIAKHATDTVVNFGDVGCGLVHRNFDDETIVIPQLPTRVFGIGFQRTATTSLAAALGKLGYDSGHWRSADWARAIWIEMHRFGRSSTVERENALCDNPIPVLYKELDKAYPGSKFILTIRDEEQWLGSVESLWSYERNVHRRSWDTDGFSHRMHGIIYGQVQYDREVFRQRYRRHNTEVISHFMGRPNDLLVMDMSNGAGWPELCEFLGHDIPEDELFPRMNRTDDD